jgi:hypothetical protein
MKVFKLFLVIFACMFVFIPVLSFAGEVKSTYTGSDQIMAKIGNILNENSQKVYQMNMGEYIESQLSSISSLLEVLDFKKLGFSDATAQAMNNNKPEFMKMLQDFAKPAFDGVNEIDSQFNSAGAYFEYVLKQMQNSSIDKAIIKDYFENADKTELNKLFKAAEAELQDQNKLLLAKKAVEEYTAKEPQQLLGGGLLSLLNPIELIRNLFDFSGMSGIDWVLTIGAGVAAFAVVSIGALILGGLVFVLGGIFSVIVGIIGIPVFIIALILSVINWILTAIVGVISGLAVATVIAAIINVVTLPLTIMLGILSSVTSIVTVVSGVITSSLAASIPATLGGLALLIFSPLVGAIGGLAGASLVKTLVSSFKKDEEPQPVQLPAPVYMPVPGYPYGGYGYGYGVQPPVQQPIQQPAYGY